MPIPTTVLNDYQSITELRRDRTKARADGGIETIGTMPQFRPASPRATAGGIRALVLLVVLGCVLAVYGRMEGSSSFISKEYVRVASLASFDDLPLAEGRQTGRAVHHAGWVWDAIDALEEFLNIGKEEEEEETESSEIQDDEGSDDGDATDGDDAEGEGEGEGQDGDDSDAGNDGDGGDGDGGEGSDGGGGDDADGDPEQSQGDDGDQGEVLSATDYVIYYFEEDEEFLNSLSEEELNLFLLEILEVLYEYVEEGSMTTTG